MLGSTLFGILMTVGLHWYKGMIVSLAIQSIMGPFGLVDNPLIKAVVWTNTGITPDAKLFQEKTAEELTDMDEVVDAQGQLVTTTKADKKKTKAAITTADGKKTKEPTLEELILDTWDSGNKAVLGPLLKALNKKNCNTQTKDDHWTALMIMSGLGECSKVFDCLERINSE
jgi:hypothetical protein